MPRILLVDDDPEFLAITKEFLLQKEPTLDILTTINPSEALEITRTQPLDAIVSDYQMPEMDGLQLLAQIRTEDNFLPFIMFTGRGREEVAIKALNLGANRYLKKEAGGAELFAELGHTLNSLIQSRASEEKYRALFDTAEDAIFTTKITDEGPRFSECNPNTLGLFGCRYEDIIGKSPIDFSPPIQPDGRSSAEVIGEIAARAMAGEPQQLEWVHCRLDKTLFDAEVTIHRVDIGSETYVQGVVRDISERKRAEEALRESEERYRSLVENIPFGMYRTTVGPKGKFLMVNPAMVNILGYDSEEELKEVVVEDVYFDPSERKIYSERFLAQGSMVGEEIRLKKKDGTLIWGAITSRAIYQDDGTIAFFDGLLEDITERKKMTDELSEFVHAMAHDIKGKLTVIQGFAELIDTDSNPTHAKRISRVVRTLSDLLERSVALADAGQAIGEMVKVDLSSLVEEVSLDFIPSTIAFEMDKLPRVKGDREKLSQAFLNLFENAITHGRPDKIEVRQQESEGESHILVSNDGAVISPEHRERIFQRGFTTKEEGGSGLGLAIVQKIIEAHNWQIRLMETEKTTFCIAIPAASLI
ncbi:MAG: PAS domain S-box protein [Candidatus Thorarchaeota archaeon]